MCFIATGRGPREEWEPSSQRRPNCPGCRYATMCCIPMLTSEAAAATTVLVQEPVLVVALVPIRHYHHDYHYDGGCNCDCRHKYSCAKARTPPKETTWNARVHAKENRISAGPQQSTSADALAIDVRGQVDNCLPMIGCVAKPQSCVCVCVSLSLSLSLSLLCSYCWQTNGLCGMMLSGTELTTRYMRTMRWYLS